MTNPGMFDPAWLEALSAALGRARARNARAGDVYLERRVERRLEVEAGEVFGAEVREEGCAIRWWIGGRDVLSCENGVSPLAVRRAAEVGRDALDVPDARAVLMSDLDVPAAWSEWAGDVALRLGRRSGSVRYVERRAAVITAAGCAEIRGPALALVRSDGAFPVSVLAVWGRRELDQWVDGALTSPEGTWRPVDGVRRPVVFTDGSGAALVHEVIGHLCESDLVASGVSPLSELMGQRLVPEAITVIDDPGREDLPGAFEADDEGVAAEPLTLIDGGRLAGWLCDRSGAAVLGGRAGRGRRSSWQDRPVPRMSNVTVAAGDRTAGEIESSVDRGLVVTRVGAATVDPAAGRVVLRVDGGWELVDGRRERASAPYHLAGEVPDVLRRIASVVGDDPTSDRHLGWCGKGGSTLPTGCETPTLLVDGLEIVSVEG